MPNQKLYKITAPVGNIVIPKEQMTEEELRNFFPQLIQDPDQLEVWKEKAEKDSIEDVIKWLELGGFSVEII